MSDDLTSVRIPRSAIVHFRSALEAAREGRSDPADVSPQGRESFAQLVERALGVAAEVTHPRSNWRKGQLEHILAVAESVTIAAVANLVARLMFEGAVPEGDLNVHLNMAEGVLTVAIKGSEEHAKYVVPTHGAKVVVRNGCAKLETVVGRVTPAMWNTTPPTDA